MYNNPYMNYNMQTNIDKINEQISNLEKMKNQLQQPIPQPTNLTQNFQLAPSNRENMRYANSIDEVQKETINVETPFFSKDMSVVWVKNTQNQIKTYELTEIVPKDEKDLQIELLQSQINDLRKEMKNNEQYITNVISTENATDTSRNDETDGETTQSTKSSSIQRVSTSKKRQ